MRRTTTVYLIAIFLTVVSFGLTLARSSPVTVTNLVATPALPVQYGNTITWTASAEGGISPLQYQFWLRNESTGVWTMMRDYSEDPAFTWTPGIQQAGAYNLQAWARSAGSSAAYEAVRSTPLWAITVDQPAVLTGLSGTPASPVAVGVPITWTATATGGSGSLEYEFRRSCNGGTLTLVQPYSPSATYSWTPSTSDTGTCYVQARVRSAGSTLPLDSILNSAPHSLFSSDPVTVTALAASPSSPTPYGTPITYTATATGGSGQLEYQFWRHAASSGTWTMAQSYGLSSSHTWTPGSGDIGAHHYQVWVRNSGSQAASEAIRTSTSYTVTPHPLITSVTPAAGSVGESVVIAGMHFTPHSGAGTVSFNGIPGDVTSWTDTNVIVTVPVGATTGPVTITSYGQSSNQQHFEVTGAPSQVDPLVTSLSSDSGSAGTAITVFGTGFGDASGTGSVWLGTRAAIVVSWSDTAIVATVASGSQTGTAQVRRADAASNQLPFTVVTPAIFGVTPSSGAVETSVTIFGTGFGSAQGSGSAWLGSTALTVTAWSDGQVQVTVPPGGTSGAVQVLQGGVLSNAVPFTVTGGPPRIDWIWPTSGNPGTTVYLGGQGFGSPQGGGRVVIGGADATITSWSDGWVQVTVGSAAVSGVLKLQQNGLWSNAKNFTVVSASGSSLTLSPSLFSLVVGESRPIQALDGAGAEVGWLAWSSSDPAVATVSDDPSPLITAVAPGTATIHAGDASAEVTVFAEGEMPEGTVLWSAPGPIAGVVDIKVAVPAPGTVADVFAIGNEGEVQAIGADGKVIWAVPAPLGWRSDSRPDFQGGLVVYNDETIVRLDPLTGHPTTLYANANLETQRRGLATPAIHPDGKVLTVDYTCHDSCEGADPDDSAAVVGIDLTTGTRAFRVPLANWTFTTTSHDSAFCRGVDDDGTHTEQYPSWPTNKLTMAADGFAYLSYMTLHTTGTQQRAAQQPYPDAAYPLFEQMRGYSSASDWPNALATLDALLAAIGEPNHSLGTLLRSDYTSGNYSNAFARESTWAPEFRRACDSTRTSITKLHLMRVNGEGETSDVVVREWTATSQVTYTLNPTTRTYTSVEVYTGPNRVRMSEHIITDEDHGALFSWQATQQCHTSGSHGSRTVIQVDPCPTVPENHLTVMHNGAVSSDSIWHPGAQWMDPVEPLLQLEDGAFAGYVRTATGSSAIAFDRLGNIRWTAPGFWPLLATDEGTIVAEGAEGTTEFDLSGSAVRQRHGVWIQSWHDNMYRLGSVEQEFRSPDVFAPTFYPQRGGNPSMTGPKVFIPPIVVYLDFKPGWDNTLAISGGLSASERAVVLETAVTTFRKAFTQQPGDQPGETVDYDVTAKVEPLKDTQVNRSNRRVFMHGRLDKAMGETYLRQLTSHVYIDNVVLTFHEALDCVGGPSCRTTVFAELPQKTGLSREELVKALGRGVGATAAHEIGHQIGLFFTFHNPCQDCYDYSKPEWEPRFSSDYFLKEQLKWSTKAQEVMRRTLPRKP